MGSRNSENSGSMNSEEFSNFIGHNYIAPPLLALPAPHHEFLFEEVANPLPLSPDTLRRVREDVNLIIAGGSARVEPGPSQDVSRSSKNSQTMSTDSVTKQGNNSTPVLEDLQDSFHVQNGVLTVFVPKDSENVTNLVNNEIVGHADDNTSTEPNVLPTQNPPPLKNWSSVLTKNIPVVGTSQHHNVQIIFNEDGSATLKPPKEFLQNARKMWDTSLLGHFIGGSFDFKFVRDTAFKMWKNKGLTRVFYSSKGYFTFKFTTVQEKNAVLALNSVQIGGRTLYLAPWMEANKFKKNVIETVPCWIKFEEVPHSYWSREGLTFLAKAVGVPLKFDEFTAKFEPTKYASVQVLLSYSSPRPDYIWVPVLDDCGHEELVKVSIIYPQLPYSCSHCKAFGHSFSRCIHNPNAVKPAPRYRAGGVNPRAAKAAKVNLNGKEQVPTVSDAGHETGNLHGPTDVNTDVNPVVLGEFLGCDLVLDEDQAIEDVQLAEDTELNQGGDALDKDLDIVPVNDSNQVGDLVLEQTITTDHVETNAAILENLESNTTVQAQLAVDQVDLPVKCPGQKRRRGRSQDSTCNRASVAPLTRNNPPVDVTTSKQKPHPVVIALKASKEDLVDEDGFTLVVNRKSPANKRNPKLASKPVSLRRVKSDKALIISKKIKKEWRWLFNYTHHYNDRVWVGWNPDVWDVSLHSMTSQVITCSAVFLEKNLAMLVSFVYAHNDAVDRAPLWNYCLNLSSTSSPWGL
ncbi:hypothetical protein AgCh_034633 [Apium graveolens]